MLGIFLSMKGCLPFVIGVAYLVIKIESVVRYIGVVYQQMRMNFNLVHGCVQLLHKLNREKEAPASPVLVMMMKRTIKLLMGKRMELDNPISTISHHLFR